MDANSSKMRSKYTSNWLTIQNTVVVKLKINPRCIRNYTEILKNWIQCKIIWIQYKFNTSSIQVQLIINAFALRSCLRYRLRPHSPEVKFQTQFPTHPRWIQNETRNRVPFVRPFSRANAIFNPSQRIRLPWIPNDPNEHAYAGRPYTLTEHTAENKLRTFPATRSEEDMRKQHLILCMKYKDPNSNETWLKSAYLNHETQTVSLMTSTNRKTRLSRPIATHASDEWFVGQYYMAAPLAFWRELKNRLINWLSQIPNPKFHINLNQYIVYIIIM